MIVRRALATATALLTAAGLALFGAAPAIAAPTDLKILVLANPVINDIDEEVALELDAIAPLGASVTVFDGGDGSAQAWAAALNGYDILVLPELDKDAPFFEADGGILSVGAATTIKGWVDAGGWVFFHGSYAESDHDYGYFLSFVTGRDYDSVFQSTWETEGSWELQVMLDGAPSTLAYTDGTYGINPNDWPTELLDGFVPIYNNISGDTVVAQFPSQGQGLLFLIGYDWYPDTYTTDYEQLIAEWGEALRALLSIQVPGGYPAVAPAVPQLAETGHSAGDTALGGMAIAGAVLLAGAGLLLVRRRSVA